MEQGKNKRCVHRLFFDPEAPKTGLYRDSDQDGDLIGYQSLFASFALSEVAQYQDKNKNDIDFTQITIAIGKGIRCAIKSCQTFFDRGFGDEKNLVEYFEHLENSIYDILPKKKDDKQHENSKDIYVPNYSEIANERIPVACPDWSILKQSAEYQLLDTAVNLTKYDSSEVLNYKIEQERKLEKIIWAPVVRFKDKGNRNELVVVDRREIESYKAVYGLLSKTLREEPDNPLSIAVFGPPGYGKSFTVKQLVYSSLPDGVEIVFKTINMTKLSGYEQLKKEIDDALDIQIQGKIPVLFFDEFDSIFETKALGWLKYFLIPMEDWEDLKALKIKDKNLSPDIDEQIKKKNKGSPIFIFAGGTSHTYINFTREDGSRLEERQHVEFKEAKGPDFVSRLRGHIDILGPNRVDDDDDAHVIRRAILLRSILRKYKYITDKNEVLVHDSIIQAMLKVSSFKHGVRSMRAVISMCVKLGGRDGKIVNSSLPTLPQLNMHVNGKEFLEMLIEESDFHGTPDSDDDKPTKA